MESQNKEILKYLKQGNSITAIEALHRFGCFRLSGRVYDLRQQGVGIKSRTIKQNGKSFSIYSML